MLHHSFSFLESFKFNPPDSFFNFLSSQITVAIMPELLSACSSLKCKNKLHTVYLHIYYRVDFFPFHLSHCCCSDQHSNQSPPPSDEFLPILDILTTVVHWTWIDTVREQLEVISVSKWRTFSWAPKIYISCRWTELDEWQTSRVWARRMFHLNQAVICIDCDVLRSCTTHFTTWQLASFPLLL